MPRATQALPPSFFFWPGQLLYMGRDVDTHVHDHHALQIVISLDGPIEIITPGAIIHCAAALIAPDQPHECRTGDKRFVLLNIAPESNVSVSLRERWLHGEQIATLAPELLQSYIQDMAGLTEGAIDDDSVFANTQQLLASLSGTDSKNTKDARVIEVLRILDEPGETAPKVTELAAKVFLSPTRLIHLFTTQVGIPIRKYILWRRLLMAVKSIQESPNITQAALEAGFSDAPHFNRTFRRMFGLSPTVLIKNSQIVQAQDQ